MNIATVLRYVDLGGGPWAHRYYILQDHYSWAEHFGVGLVAIGNKNDIERICESCEGLVITGSATNINPKYYGGEDTPDAVDEYALDAALIKYFHEHKKPILGICGGHQALNVYFGGTLKKIDDPKKHLGEFYDVRSSHYINIEKSSFIWDAFESERAVVNNHHSWEIARLAPNLKAVARTDDGVIEAIESVEDKVFATQWHPELSFHDETDNPCNVKLIENFLKLCEKNK